MPFGFITPKDFLNCLAFQYFDYEGYSRNGSTALDLISMLLKLFFVLILIGWFGGWGFCI
jgi:hypothetical protein